MGMPFADGCSLFQHNNIYIKFLTHPMEVVFILQAYIFCQRHGSLKVLCNICPVFRTYFRCCFCYLLKPLSKVEFLNVSHSSICQWYIPRRGLSFYDGSCSCASSFLRFLVPDVFTKHVISCGHLPDVLMDVCGFILDSGPDTH